MLWQTQKNREALVPLKTTPAMIPILNPLCSCQRRKLKLQKKMRRAKLHRFALESDPPEWKERGTGNIKLLKHKQKGTIRVLMRRDLTLRICANHLNTPAMDLKPNKGSSRVWVWSRLC